MTYRSNLTGADDVVLITQKDIDSEDIIESNKCTTEHSELDKRFSNYFEQFLWEV